MDKGQLQISFGWLFAIIVGAFILFLAIFLSVKIVDQGNTEVNAKTGKEFGILLNPLETGFDSTKSSSITMPVDSRIYNTCNELQNSVFGTQLIEVSQKSFGEWAKTDLQVGFLNKYLFSEEVVEGKKYYIFSKAFDFPFKVSDIIVITSSKDNYCFVDAPEDISKDISRIGQANFKVENCSEDSIRICFERGSRCDINVNYDQRKVTKGSGSVYFEGDALMYGAIFSDKDLYECQVKRLMKRVKVLSDLYFDKANFVAERGCDSALNTQLNMLSSGAENYKSSTDLSRLQILAEEIREINEDNTQCRLW